MTFIFVPTADDGFRLKLADDVPYQQLVRSQNSRTSIFDLNIRELPLIKKETGNTLETRGLTYSYTFYTNPKNTHLGCKGTKHFPNSQKVSTTFSDLLYINTT